MRAVRNLLVGVALLAGGAALAAAPKSYQATGQVVEVKDDTLIVMKGKEKFEIATGGQSTAELKPGAKVTVEYRMTATSIESKDAAKAPAKDAKPAAKPAKK